MFKFGDVLECVRSRAADALTVGGRYRATIARGRAVQVKNDKGLVRFYKAARFKLFARPVSHEQYKDRVRRASSLLHPLCLPCSECGNPKAERHHPTYESTDIVWLCRKCHMREHKRLRDAERASTAP